MEHGLGEKVGVAFAPLGFIVLPCHATFSMLGSP